jgi:site-specific recombinase XerD
VINHFFTHPRVLARLRQGVLAEFLDDYAKSLHDQGYSRESIRIQLRLIGAFGRWLKCKSIVFQEIDRGILDGFLRRRHRHHSVQNGEVSTLQRFLAVAILRQGTGPKRSPNQPVESVAVIDEYREYLSQERGFAESTIRYYSLFAARFLSEERIGSLRELTHVRAVDVSGFVQRHARRQSPGSARLMVTALRCFFRYLRYNGRISNDLAAAVPAVANWSMSSVPKSLPAGVVRRVLKCCNRRTSLGKRNYAILMLLARLGLRAGEISGMNMDDIDWSTSQISIHGKGGSHICMPLPADVGESIAVYLRSRPRCSIRKVFVRGRAPFVAFSSSTAISGIVRRALSQTGVASVCRGAHVFRHSLATELLRRGSSLDEIGEVLRLQSPNTTAIYAKVDLNSLRSIALPWQGGGK